MFCDSSLISLLLFEPKTIEPRLIVQKQRRGVAPDGQHGLLKHDPD